MILECFHLVSLLRTLSRLMQENMFLQQKGAVSPISRVSAVNSGCSPITHEGKSNRAMLEKYWGIQNWDMKFEKLNLRKLYLGKGL